ncbi:MAG: outer membrane protein assembly factor BamB [gamma proteobacterium endosymbiont of Lamellibrachia anaximandri]|nr:outer membrane protein assembly factor BamB [gamma proteobacterium endosymbiont of Lamellibrachia anaximandri]MBL3533605.1 outer membrane protein assembly factor BamB [gamma proteobacterium endosymbiont of Lamellibrachia anaximandri]
MTIWQWKHPEVVMKRVWFGFFLLLLLSGCSSLFSAKDNADPPAELVDFTAALELETLWQLKVGGTDGKFLEIAPAVAGEQLFIADPKGRVVAVDRLSGKRLWDVETRLPVSGGPGVGNGLVLLGTAEAELVALGAADGSEKWRRRVSSEVLSVPAASRGVVVVRTVDGRAAGLSADTGANRWTFDHSEPVLTLRGNSAPIINEDQVFIGFSNGKLAGLSLDGGTANWEATVATAHGRTELERIVDIDSDPVVVEGVVYAASFQGQVAAVSESSGVVLWRRDISVHAGLDADWRQLYVTDDEDAIWALEAGNGATLWQQKALHARKLSAPAIIGNYLVAGDYDGYLHWFSQEDGRMIARIRVGSEGIRAKPLVVDGIVYVFDDSGKLTALRMRLPETETP